MGDYENLQRTDNGSVTTVTLSRPDSRNALDAALIGEVTRLFEALVEEDGVRVVISTGEGAVFCAGADVGYMREIAGFSYEENLEDAQRLAEMYAAVDRCPKPVVARVRGAAMGGGAGLVAAADVAVTEEGTRFGFPEVRLGIAPATIAPFVARKIGASHARALFLTGERFDARSAKEIGLVHEVAPEGGLDTAVEAKVAELLAGGPMALATVKGMLREIESVDPVEALGLMPGVIATLRAGEEGQEGLGAFLQKREPRWRRP